MAIQVFCWLHCAEDSHADKVFFYQSAANVVAFGTLIYFVVHVSPMGSGHQGSYTACVISVKCA